MRKNPTSLAMLATLAVGAAMIAALAGKNQATPQPAAAPGDSGHKRTASGGGEEALPDPLLELAARYALSARNWRPASYRESWQEQIELAGGRLRRELSANLPGADELRALREDRAHSTAKLVRAQRDARVSAAGVRMVVTLDETTAAAGQTIRGLSVNQVELRRQAGRWRVVGFTVLPGGATPGSGS